MEILSGVESEIEDPVSGLVTTFRCLGPRPNSFTATVTLLKNGARQDRHINFSIAIS
jgi:hypothetical protein